MISDFRVYLYVVYVSQLFTNDYTVKCINQIIKKIMRKLINIKQKVAKDFLVYFLNYIDARFPSGTKTGANRSKKLFASDEIVNDW